MNYLKYSILFVVICLGLYCIDVSVVNRDALFLIFFIIALIVAAAIVANIIIKSNGRAMTLKEIVKYVLYFSIITAIVVIVMLSIMISIRGYGSLPFGRYISLNQPIQFSMDYITGHYVNGFIGIFVAVLIPTLISMFSVNNHFKSRYADALYFIKTDTPHFTKGTLISYLKYTILFFIIFLGLFLASFTLLRMVRAESIALAISLVSASAIATAIVISMVIKSNNGIKFGEIVNYIILFCAVCEVGTMITSMIIFEKPICVLLFGSNFCSAGLRMFTWVPTLFSICLISSIKNIKN
ncbi:MAG: hypothetical protein LBG67_03515 [Campylobacteraceae bacterium]|jgi:hypothetical protein|nr:hypothetical protein [Campylobacteraceae bacterium]